MFLRIIFSCFFISLCISCEFLVKIKENTFSSKELDTVIDYTKVDVLPTFPICDSIMDVTQKNRCFINNLYVHFSQELLKHTFDVPGSINETVTVKLKIDANGKANLVAIESSPEVKMTIPLLDSIIAESVGMLPILFPALKRGIPVATIYELPIVIKLK
tara:strand:- start:6758 stop:7237 length:480 start_codon:yes stop_codon:yes gene_type:complete